MGAYGLRHPDVREIAMKTRQIGWRTVATGLLGLVLTALIVRSPLPAQADAGYWSDGWPACNWVGATWFNPSTVGWGKTEGPTSCADRAVLRLEWYDGSQWHDTGFVYSAWGVNWNQMGGSPAYSLVGTHQIHVIGWGYSNWGGTQEP